MHIAFDFHGVLEKYPEKFKPMMIALKKAGHTVSIMSGPHVIGCLKKLIKLTILDILIMTT